MFALSHIKIDASRKNRLIVTKFCMQIAFDPTIQIIKLRQPEKLELQRIATEHLSNKTEEIIILGHTFYDRTQLQEDSGQNRETTERLSQFLNSSLIAIQHVVGGQL